MNRMKIITAGVALVAAACTTDAARNADTAAAIDTATGTGATIGASDTAMAPEPSAPAAGGMMDPNSASATDLAAIRGMTSDVAAKIVAGRPYATNTDVDKVLGTTFTEQQRDSIYARMWIPLDVNKASREEILLVPGVGTRMLREFLEYRPYASIEQFRREIGKYVDKDEVARLEKYVKI